MTPRFPSSELRFGLSVILCAINYCGYSQNYSRLVDCLCRFLAFIARWNPYFMCSGTEGVWFSDLCIPSSISEDNHFAGCTICHSLKYDEGREGVGDCISRECFLFSYILFDIALFSISIDSNFSVISTPRFEILVHFVPIAIGGRIFSTGRQQQRGHDWVLLISVSS